MNSDNSENLIRAVDTWSSQWDDFCQELVYYGEETPPFENVIENTKTSFGHVIQQVLFDNLSELAVPLNQIRCFDRAVNEADEKKVIKGRFIPQPEYASLNRMNDKNKLYLYLSISYRDSAGVDVIKTALKECRAELDHSIWKCRFSIPEYFKDKKVIDLSTVRRMPADEQALSRLIFRNSKEYVHNTVSINKSKVNYWLIQTVLSIFEKSKMFEPIDKNQPDEEQRKYYKPFHVICDYLERQEYYGIIYRSSVYKKGRCLALFNPQYAECDFDTCEKIDVKKYI